MGLDPRKGFVFTLDSMLGATLLLLGIAVFSLFFITEVDTTQPTLLSQDSIDFLSEMGMVEIDAPVLHDLREIGPSLDTDLSVLEQIALFWVKEEHDAAYDLSRYVFEKMIPPQYGYSIVVGGEEIYSRAKPGNKTLVSSKKTVTGIEKDKEVERFLTYAHLTGMDTYLYDRYVYFGGFTGQGNITVAIDLPEYINITNVTIEGAFSHNFSLFINSTWAGYYNFTDDDPMKAETFWVNYSYFNDFERGNITMMHIRFNTSDLGYIGGGYIKVRMNMSTNQSNMTPQFTEYHGESYLQRHYFPQVDGFVNQYGSYYFPPRLLNISGMLHYRSDIGQVDNVSLKLIIGNESIFNDTSFYGDEIVKLVPDNFSGLNLALLAGKNVPMRFGWIGANFSFGGVKAVLITDLSTSMDYDIPQTGGGEVRGCDDPLLYDDSTERLSLAKCLDKDFVNNLLDESLHSNVGLVSFSTRSDRFTELRDDAAMLIGDIDEYETISATCIACGIFKAIELLKEYDILLPKHSDYKYNLDFILPGNDPPAGWKDLAFNDDDWLTGTAPFGFGFDGINTNIDRTMMNPTYEYRPISYCYYPSGTDCAGFLTCSPALVNTDDEINQCLLNDTTQAPAVFQVGDTSSTPTSKVSYPEETKVQHVNDLYRFPACDRVTEYCFRFDTTPNVWQQKPPPSADFIIFRPFSDRYEKVYSFQRSLSKEFDLNTGRKVCYNPNQKIKILDGDVIGLFTNFGEIYDTAPSGGTQIRKQGLHDELLYSDPTRGGRLMVGMKCEQDRQQRNITAVFGTDGFSDRDAKNLLTEIDILPEEDVTYKITYAIYSASGTFRGWRDVCDGSLEKGVVTHLECLAPALPDNDRYFSSMLNKAYMQLEILFDCESCTSGKVHIDYVGITAITSSGDLYFRKKFDVSEQYDEVILEVLDDDSATVYIDGVQIPTNDYLGRDWFHFRNLTGPRIPSPGRHILAVKLENQDIDSMSFDSQLKTPAPRNSSIPRAMVVMSDGVANMCYPTGLCGSILNPPIIDPAQQARDFACEAFIKHGIRIYSIGFAVSGSGLTTLENIAACDDENHFYQSQDPEELQEIYDTLAEDIAKLGYEAQAASILGDVESILYNDSYLEFNISTGSDPISTGLIPLTVQTPPFGNNISELNISLRDGMIIQDARITSYSGDKWTRLVWINNSLENLTVFNLTDFGRDYVLLGDPFIIEFPPDALRGGGNMIHSDTGITPTGLTNGSPSNRLIFTTLISPRSRSLGLGDYEEGCGWNIEFEDDLKKLMLTPQHYAGPLVCAYNSTNHTLQDNAYDGNNSMHIALHDLLSRLDFDQDGRLDVEIGEPNLLIKTATTDRIPNLWGPTLVEVKIWQ